MGFTPFAVDHAANRHSPKVKIFTLDVSNPQQLELLETMICFTKPCYIHLGLPCGTCSRAREKPMPAKLGGHMGPKPLRNEIHLLGLPDLQGADKTKVELANQLYQCAISILMLCFKLQCMLSIENPARSGSCLHSWLGKLGTKVSFSGIQSWKAFISTHAPMAALETNAQNFWLALARSVHWHRIAPETTLICHGNHTNQMGLLFFQRHKKRNTLLCCATEWLTAFCRKHRLRTLCRYSPND